MSELCSSGSLVLCPGSWDSPWCGQASLSCSSQLGSGFGCAGWKGNGNGEKGDPRPLVLPAVELTLPAPQRRVLPG